MYCMAVKSVKYLVTGSKDATIKVWNITNDFVTAQLLHTFKID